VIPRDAHPDFTGHADQTQSSQFSMHVALTIFAVLFVIAGFVGFAYGGLPTLLFWALAALCVAAGWKLRPAAQRRREQRLSGPAAR
jgi:cytochrome c oxidase subunit IV